MTRSLNALLSSAEVTFIIVAALFTTLLSAGRALSSWLLKVMFPCT
jgi:hypothetical protein